MEPLAARLKELAVTQRALNPTTCAGFIYAMQTHAFSQDDLDQTLCDVVHYCSRPRIGVMGHTQPRECFVAIEQALIGRGANAHQPWRMKPPIMLALTHFDTPQLASVLIANGATMRDSSYSDLEEVATLWMPNIVQLRPDEVQRLFPAVEERERMLCYMCEEKDDLEVSDIMFWIQLGANPRAQAHPEGWDAATCVRHQLAKRSKSKRLAQCLRYLEGL